MFSIKNIFPESNPNAIFFEIESDYELRISTWLGYEQHSQQEIENMADLTIKIFEDIFQSPTEEIFALVNHWDINRDMYVLNQFQAYTEGNYAVRKFIDETQEVEKEQFLFETDLTSVKYKDILKTSLVRDYAEINIIDSRIFFTHPEKEMYFHYFDGGITIGSNHLERLKPLFHKYYDHIYDPLKKKFLDQNQHSVKLM